MSDVVLICFSFSFLSVSLFMCCLCSRFRKLEFHYGCVLRLLSYVLDRSGITMDEVYSALGLDEELKAQIDAELEDDK